LPEKPSLDGRSLVPLLTEPSVAWNQPSLTVFGEGNSSIHGERFHYIRYKDGTEEFYDLASDPMEWDNLIRHLTVEQEIEKQRLAELIPERFAPPVEATDKKLNQTGRRLNESIKATRPLDRLK
jgi:iduronate 2-sulfatase